MCWSSNRHEMVAQVIGLIYFFAFLDQWTLWVSMWGRSGKPLPYQCITSQFTLSHGRNSVWNICTERWSSGNYQNEVRTWSRSLVDISPSFQQDWVNTSYGLACTYYIHATPSRAKLYMVHTTFIGIGLETTSLPTCSTQGKRTFSASYKCHRWGSEAED